jgi:hypothetical protein
VNFQFFGPVVKLEREAAGTCIAIFVAISYSLPVEILTNIPLCRNPKHPAVATWKWKDYEAAILVSGTFMHNQWSDVAGLAKLLPGAASDPVRSPRPKDSSAISESLIPPALANLGGISESYPMRIVRGLSSSSSQLFSQGLAVLNLPHFHTSRTTRISTLTKNKLSSWRLISVQIPEACPKGDRGG